MFSPRSILNQPSPTQSSAASTSVGSLPPSNVLTSTEMLRSAKFSVDSTAVTASVGAETIRFVRDATLEGQLIAGQPAGSCLLFRGTDGTILAVNRDSKCVYRCTDGILSFRTEFVGTLPLFRQAEAQAPEATRTAVTPPAATPEAVRTSQGASTHRAPRDEAVRVGAGDGAKERGVAGTIRPAVGNPPTSAQGIRMSVTQRRFAAAAVLGVAATAATILTRPGGDQLNSRPPEPSSHEPAREPVAQNLPLSRPLSNPPSPVQPPLDSQPALTTPPERSMETAVASPATGDNRSTDFIAATSTTVEPVPDSPPAGGSMGPLLVGGASETLAEKPVTNETLVAITDLETPDQAASSEAQPSPLERDSAGAQLAATTSPEAPKDDVLTNGTLPPRPVTPRGTSLHDLVASEDSGSLPPLSLVTVSPVAIQTAGRQTGGGSFEEFIASEDVATLSATSLVVDTTPPVVSLSMTGSAHDGGIQGYIAREDSDLEIVLGPNTRFVGAAPRNAPALTSIPLAQLVTDEDQLLLGQVVFHFPPTGLVDASTDETPSGARTLADNTRPAAN